MKQDSDLKIVQTALREVGLAVDDVWDLISMRGTYSKALPTLTRILPRIGDGRLKEGVVRALSIREARGKAGRVLVEELRKLADSQRDHASLAWALGNALSIVVTPEEELFDDLVALLRDRRLGTARQMLTEALTKTKHPNVEKILLELLSDDSLTGHIIYSLGQLKSTEARPHIERHLSHSNSWIRKEARRALKKINKADV